MSGQSRSRLKPVDIFVIAAVLIISAVIMRSLLPGKESTMEARFQGALRVAMEQFYKTPGVDVQLTGALDARIQLQFPPGSRQRRPEWAYGLARFVALQYPQIKLNGLTIIDDATGQPIPLTPPVLARADQASLAYQEGAQSEVLRRAGQTICDDVFGVGRCLVLVDVACQGGPSADSKRDRVAPSQNRVAAPKRPQGGKTCNLERVDHSEAVVTISHLEVFVVFNEANPNFQDKVEFLLQKSIKFQPERGDILTVLALPGVNRDTHGVSH